MAINKGLELSGRRSSLLIRASRGCHSKVEAGKGVGGGSEVAKHIKDTLETSGHETGQREEHKETSRNRNKLFKKYEDFLPKG
jgi:hypothetical protein